MMTILAADRVRPSSSSIYVEKSGGEWRRARVVALVARGGANNARTRRIGGTDKVPRNIEDNSRRQRKGGHNGDSAANIAIRVALMCMAAGMMLVRRLLGLRRGSLHSGHMRGVIVMSSVRIGGWRRSCRGRGLLRGRFDHIQSKLILRGGVGDQRDRNQPRGEP